MSNLDRLNGAPVAPPVEPYVPPPPPPPVPPPTLQAPGQQAARPADKQLLTSDRGPRTMFGLPGQASAPPAPVPAYEKAFGQASYVKDGADPGLVGLARRVAAGSPDLAGGAFGAAAKAGKLSRDDVKALQAHLQAKGFDVGHTGVDGKFGPRTHAALQAYLNGAKPPAKADGQPPADGEKPADGAARTGPMQGAGMEKDGLRIPAGEGRATTFWNGHLAYKGVYDVHNKQNNGLGAWGDKCAPTDYFVALPVKDRRWHNQKILITNPATGQQVVARVQDKGPAARTGAKIDLSPVTMEAIGGHFRGDLKNVRFEFAPADAPVGPVR